MLPARIYHVIGVRVMTIIISTPAMTVIIAFTRHKQALTRDGINPCSQSVIHHDYNGDQPTFWVHNEASDDSDEENENEIDDWMEGIIYMNRSIDKNKEGERVSVEKDERGASAASEHKDREGATVSIDEDECQQEDIEEGDEEEFRYEEH